MEAVRRIERSFTAKTLLADLKIMDAGEGEASLAFEAGAGIVTVLGVAHDETIRARCVRPRSSGARSWLI